MNTNRACLFCDGARFGDQCIMLGSRVQLVCAIRVSAQIPNPALRPPPEHTGSAEGLHTDGRVFIDRPASSVYNFFIAEAIIYILVVFGKSSLA